MIIELTVENLAVIERSQITFGKGFSVLTGETGAGKSLLIDAIELALGERADTELIRSGAKRATVSIVVDVSASLALQTKCEELGVSVEEGTIFIQREVIAEGRSICRIGGKLAPVATLKSLGQALVDLHGQHDHQSLLHPERHVEFLDLWIGEPAARHLKEVGEAFSGWSVLVRKLASLRSGLRDREQRIDVLSYQIQEIESVSPQLGEFAELANELSRLGHAEKLSLCAQESLAELVNDEAAALDKISASIKRLEEATRLDSAVEPILDPLRSGWYLIQEAVHELSAYGDQIESDPAQLEAVAQRLDSLKSLRRKFGDTEEAVLEFWQNARLQLDDLQSGETNVDELELLCGAAKEVLEQKCRELTHLRSMKALEFSTLVQSNMADLEMQKSVLFVSIQPRTPDACGADDIQFQFSANLGEEAKPLAKIASGGEISRVMLAIKSVLAGRAGVPTLIFDEVDAGLSGKAASSVARKLEELASDYQVIVISHLPQIASRAQNHFRIEKKESLGRVQTTVRQLSESERIEEIARMIAGDNLSPTALVHAEEMIATK